MLLSFAYFFCILFAYFILQPLRDEIGLLLGKAEIPVLFRWSLVAMIVANPIFSALVTKMERRRFVSIAFRFFSLNILLFIGIFKWLENAGILGLQADGTPLPLEGWHRLLPSVYFVWVGVYNLFSVTIFWALMADLFKGGRARKVFGFIGAGGTLGQLLGSLATGTLVYWLGPTNLLFISILLIELSVQIMHRLLNTMDDVPPSEIDPVAPAAAKEPKSVMEGILAIFRSPYLIGICCYLFLFTFTSSFLYFQKQEIVSDTILNRADRVSFFSKINLSVSICTVLTQVLLTGHLLPWLGVLICLSLVPIATGLGFVILGYMPTLWAIAIFEVSRKTVNYSLSRPSREVLFTVVSREEKYLSKSFIDTFVYRTGDASASVVFPALKATYDLGAKGLCWATIPFTVLWLGVSLWLGKRYQKLSADEES